MINLITRTLIGSPFFSLFVRSSGVCGSTPSSIERHKPPSANQPTHQNCVVALRAWHVRRCSVLSRIRIISREWIKFSRLSILTSFTLPVPHSICLFMLGLFHSFSCARFVPIFFFVLHRYSSRAS